MNIIYPTPERSLGASCTMGLRISLASSSLALRMREMSCVTKLVPRPLPQINCCTTTGSTRERSTSSAGLKSSSSPLPCKYSEGNLRKDELKRLFKDVS